MPEVPERVEIAGKRAIDGRSPHKGTTLTYKVPAPRWDGPVWVRNDALSTRPLAFGARGLVEAFAIAFREMRGGDEAARERHVEHRHLGLLEQMARLVEAQLEIETRRGAGEIFAEQPLQLASRNLHGAGKLGPAHRLFQVFFHAPDGRQQLGMANAQARRQGHALAIALVADALMDELIRDRRRQGEAVLRRDDMRHQIKGCDAARTGEAVAIDFEEFGGDLELGKGLGEAREILP